MSKKLPPVPTVGNQGVFQSTKIYNCKKFQHNVKRLKKSFPFPSFLHVTAPFPVPAYGEPAKRRFPRVHGGGQYMGTKSEREKENSRKGVHKK